MYSAAFVVPVKASDMIPTLSAALAERGYDKLTDVQEAVLNPELAGQDLLVSARTGSGKTVGFGLSIAEDVLDDQGMAGRVGLPTALIVAPTRELAFQVKRELEWLYEQTGAVIASAVGGMDPRNERRALERGAHVVVGTPGRIRDHIERNALDLSMIRAIVLDEADEMLDLGFREDLEFILGEAPDDKRSLMFSATVPPMIAKLAQEFQKDAVRVEVTSKTEQHADITYQVLSVAPHDAEHAMINMLLFHDPDNTIIFANTRAAVARLTARLSNRGFQVVALSGELTQTERSHALQAMRDGRAKVCVATDVAARGIDLPGLELVIHAETPQNTETLLHRSGRTGRAGRKGISALIATPRDRGKITRLMKWAKLDAEWISPPSAEEVQTREEERLIDNPAWSVEPNEEQLAFAGKLLERYSAEQVAAAYLKLYQDRRCAPEELGGDTREPRERKSHEDFGPSKWFSLSIGRNGRAEPRWIMPMICKQAGLNRNSIGKIRITDDQTYVEVKEEDAKALATREGGVVEMEQGLTFSLMDEAPKMDAPRDRKPRGDRPDRGSRPDRGDRPAKFDRKPREDRGDRKPREDRQDRPARKPREDRPERSERPAKFEKPRKDDRPRREDREERAPRKEFAPKPADKPRDEAPKPKPRSKPDFDVSDPSSGRKSRSRGGDSKPFARKGADGKKPGGKPSGPKKFGKPPAKKGDFKGKPRKGK